MSNQWWEIKIKTTPELEDLIFWRLHDFGCQGTATVSENDLIVITAYLPMINTDVLDLSAFSLLLRQDITLNSQSSFSVHWQLIDQEDWSSSWKKHWQPLEIGDRFLIYPAWLEPPANKDKRVIRLDPGAAFGTGVHPTTQLCLESLEMRLEPEINQLVLADIGCGSGILSLGAKLLGNHQIYALDLDPLAVKATQENSALNNISDLHIYQGSIEKLQALKNLKFDGIICNILAEVIKELVPNMTEIMKPEGWAILSGMILDQSREVTSVLEKYGWDIASLHKRDQWCCINACHRNYN
jgi:ribosomal protein L11 methyltransferase